MSTEEALYNAQECLKVARRKWAAGDKKKAMEWLEKSLKHHVTPEASVVRTFWQMGKDAPEMELPTESAASEPVPLSSNLTPKPAVPSPKATEKDYTPEQQEVAIKIASLSNYYDIIGVPKTATEVEIKKGYRKRSIQVHPVCNTHTQLLLLVFFCILPTLLTHCS